MNEYSIRIKNLIEESGMGYAEIERLTGIPKSNLQRYASGTTSKIPLDVVEKLSTLFLVSPAYIMGWEEQKEKPTDDDGLSDSQKLLIEFAKSVPEDQAAMVLRVVRSIVEGD